MVELIIWTVGSFAVLLPLLLLLSGCDRSQEMIGLRGLRRRRCDPWPPLHCRLRCRRVLVEQDGGLLQGPGGMCRRGTNGVSTNEVTADFMFFDGGTFWVLPLTYFYLPKSARAYLFPNLSNKSITFAAAPLVLTPFVRNRGPDQGAARGEACRGDREDHERGRRFLFRFRACLAHTCSKTSTNNQTNTTYMCIHIYIYIYATLFLFCVFDKQTNQ